MTDLPEKFESEDAEQSAGDEHLRELVLVKRENRYVFRYAPGQEQEMLQSLVRLAQDPSSELDWFDAAVLSHQIGRRISQQLEQIRVANNR